MGWKDTNKHLQILKSAEEGGYGVIATIAYVSCLLLLTPANDPAQIQRRKCNCIRPSSQQPQIASYTPIIPLGP